MKCLLNIFLNYTINFVKTDHIDSFLSYTCNSLEEVTGDLALEVPQWFIAVLISPDPTFYKTNGCQADTLEPFEKSKMAAKRAAKKTKNRKLHKTLPDCHKWSCSSTFLGFWGSRNPNLIFSDSKWPPLFKMAVILKNSL